MAVFYVLPPRSMVAERWQCFWRSVLPGAELPPDAERPWPEALARSAESVPGVFVVFRDELDDPREPAEGLRDRFGAGPGDQIVDVRWDRPTDVPRVRVGRFSNDPRSVPDGFGYTALAKGSESNL